MVHFYQAIIVRGDAGRISRLCFISQNSYGLFLFATLFIRVLWSHLDELYYRNNVIDGQGPEILSRI